MPIPKVCYFTIITEMAVNIESSKLYDIQSNSDNAYPLGNMIKVLNTRSTQ